MKLLNYNETSRNQDFTVNCDADSVFNNHINIVATHLLVGALSQNLEKHEVKISQEHIRLITEAPNTKAHLSKKQTLLIMAHILDIRDWLVHVQNDLFLMFAL